MDVVAYLLDRGCGLNHAEADGTTGLHDAARHGFVAVADLLCRHGARLDGRNGAGEVAADVAARCGHVGVADVLRAVERRRRDHGFKRAL